MYTGLVSVAISAFLIYVAAWMGTQFEDYTRSGFIVGEDEDIFTRTHTRVGKEVPVGSGEAEMAVRVCVYMCVCVCLCACMYVCMLLDSNFLLHIHIHTNAHTHAHIQSLAAVQNVRDDTSCGILEEGHTQAQTETHTHKEIEEEKQTGGRKQESLFGSKK